MLGKAAAATFALLLAFPAVAYADGWRLDDRGSHPRRHHDSHNSWSQWVFSHDRNDDSDEDSDSDDDNSDSGDDQSDDSSPAPAAGGTVLDGSAQTIQAELTGYSFQDNTPAGSADICCPILHQKAGGTGTFADPITTAVPTGERKPGTRLYIAKLKRYFIVEDSGATGTGKPRFDVWVDGQGFSKGDSDSCASELTGSATVILNPADGLAVTVGPLTRSGGCKI